MQRPVILDMDPGVDDALGILLAVRSPEIEVKAITICGGNVGLDQCALNALKALGQARVSPEPPVARGASRPVRRSPFRAGGIHGPDGLGNTSHKYPDHPLSDLASDHAVDLILEAARSLDQGQLTVVATAPLTNIALAISKDPEAMRRVGRIVWMGGAYATFGNITPVAEFNAFCDPDAAQEVLSFGIPMTVVGLDACMQCPLTRQELGQSLEQSNSPVTNFAWDICQMYMDFYLKYEGFDGCYLHDPLAVGIAIWSEDRTLVRKKAPHHIQVITDPGPALGQTVIDRRPRNPWTNARCLAALAAAPSSTKVLQEFGVLAAPPHVDVVMEVDGDEFVRRFLQRVVS